jgi:alpha-beta hydrolase superfamily lysophospholipase
VCGAFLGGFPHHARAICSTCSTVSRWFSSRHHKPSTTRPVGGDVDADSARLGHAGAEIAYDVLGAGPAVVLTHGAPSWSYLWRNVAPEPARTYSVYLWDLPGYGDSRWTTE